MASTSNSSDQGAVHRSKMADHPDPDPAQYELEIYEKGLKFERTKFTFDTKQWESIACGRLSAESRSYVQGSAGQRETDDKNRAAFRKWSIVPRRLVDQHDSMPDLSVTVFGERLPYPIAIAPVGVQSIFHHDGEGATARAAATVNVPYILSTASSTSIEDVAAANGPSATRWFQLYWPGNKANDITVSMLQRAKAQGYTALFVTLDTYLLGWRPTDMDNGYNPFMRADSIGVEIGFTDPVYQKKFQEKHGKTISEDPGAAAAEWMRTVFPGFSHVPEDVKFLQKNWDGPIVLKGIQSVADAKLAVDLGVQGIVVSNHGGRQQDGGCGSLTVLPKIVDAVGDKLEIFFDSGIRCGADIAKALALGAKMCLIGRPFVYGLAMGGEEGVRHVLRSLLGDLEITLHMSGLPGVQKSILNRDVLMREDEY